MRSHAISRRRISGIVPLDICQKTLFRNTFPADARIHEMPESWTRAIASRRGNSSFSGSGTTSASIGVPLHDLAQHAHELIPSKQDTHRAICGAGSIASGKPLTPIVKRFSCGRIRDIRMLLGHRENEPTAVVLLFLEVARGTIAATETGRATITGRDTPGKIDHIRRGSTGRRRRILTDLPFNSQRNKPCVPPSPGQRTDSVRGKARLVKTR